MRAPGLIAVALLLGACAGATSGSLAPAPGVDGPEPSASNRTPWPTVSAAPVRKASASAPASWGPLAVRPPEDGTDLAAIQGTLRITARCVYLESAGGLVFLTWLADRTTWNDELRTITYENFDGPAVTISDGDYVELGGGDSDSDISAEEWINAREWVAPPDASCELDRRFYVGIVAD